MSQTPAAIAINVIFVTLGLTTACLWFRWSNIPHWLDMTIGMLTLGNLGMLLGWWADNGFARLPTGCCECTNALRDGLLKPWMPIGMLVFASLAMVFLRRRGPSEMRWCKTSMFGGGNVGMVAGMLLGGRASTLAETNSVSLAVLLSYLGMTAGMVAGMLLGTELTGWLLGRHLAVTEK